MRITRLELDGIGPFEKAEFEFPPPDPGDPGELVLFEGPNGSGKTSLMLSIALALLSDPRDKRLWESLGLHNPGAGEILNPPPFLWHKRARARAELRISIADAETEVAWGFKPPEWSELQLNPAARQLNSVASRTQQFIDAAQGKGTTGWAAYSFASHQRTPVLAVSGPAPIDKTYLQRALFFGEKPPQLSPNSIVARLDRLEKDEDAPNGPPLGQLLSNFDYERSRAIAYGTRSSSESQRTKLDAAASSYEDALQRMQSALSEVLDRAVRFDFRLGEPAPRVLFDEQEIPLELLGEGLRSTFSWLSDLLIQLLLTPWSDKSRSPLDQDFWLLLDEVDQSLHPQMQLRLLPALRKLFKRARIYATTHSPFVVASAGRGHVFSIAPERTSRRVRGPQQALKLEPGQTLERIVSEVFDSPSLFVDPETRSRLAAHEKDVLALRRGQPLDWDGFLANRTWLMERTDEVRAVVAMREVPVQKPIEVRLREVGA